MAENVDSALVQLTQALALEKKTPLPIDDCDEQEISLGRRALPLIALLQAAVKQKCNVMWT